jgi:hypothetical protein
LAVADFAETLAERRFRLDEFGGIWLQRDKVDDDN